jgi:hypothetical protein
VYEEDWGCLACFTLFFRRGSLENSGWFDWFLSFFLSPWLQPFRPMPD